MKNKTQNITTLYEELAVTALNHDEFQPWIRHKDSSEKLPLTTIDLGKLVFDLELWVKTATTHHLTPPMNDEAFTSLKAAIRRYGLIDGVIYINNQGRVIDGYHRMKAIYELLKEKCELSPPEVRFIEFQNEADEMAFVLLQNVTRRMINDNQMEDILKEILRSGHDGTDNWLSNLCGLSSDTVHDIRSTLEHLPAEEGGIEHISERRSEAGKSYKQKKSEPMSKKRRVEAGLAPTNKTVNTDKEENTKTIITNVANTTSEHKAKSNNESKDLNNKTGEKEINQPSSPKVDNQNEILKENDENKELRTFISDWWISFQFLPVSSKELASLKNQRTGKQSSAGDPLSMTTFLKPKVGKVIFGHLLLHRKMAAGVAVFILSPCVDESTEEINWDLLINKAGKVS
jgi:ParB-like chromosome segregation protein Spo0J